MPPTPASRRSNLRPVAAIAAALLAVAGAAGLDLASRTRAAYRRAEGWERLARRPAEREAALEKRFLRGIDALDRGRLSAAERQVQVEILRKRWEEARLRSPWAEAYHAWRDVPVFFAPPESLWTRRARLMAPADRQRWREDWTARGLPFDESLLDGEPGGEEGGRLVYSAGGPRELSRAQAALASAGVPARVLPPLPAARREFRLLVAEDRFWEAHRALLPLVGLDENW